MSLSGRGSRSILGYSYSVLLDHVVRVPDIDADRAIKPDDGQDALVDQLSDGALGTAEVFGSLPNRQKPRAGGLRAGLLLG